MPWQGVGGGASAAFQASRLSAADQFSYTDIRYDEDYDKFYQAAAGTPGLKLPPPLDSRTLYTHLPHYNPSLAGTLQQPPGAPMIGLGGPQAYGEHSCYEKLKACRAVVLSDAAVSDLLCTPHVRGVTPQQLVTACCRSNRGL